MSDDALADRTASAIRSATRPHRYSFAQVLEYTEVPENRVVRWLQAGIIKAVGGGGSQGVRREFSFKNLIEVQVCNELRTLGFSEPGLYSVVESLNAIWSQPDEITNPRFGTKYRDVPILWLALQHVTVDGRSEDHCGIFPVDLRDLVSRVTDGQSDDSGIAETGIAIPIARITADLEKKTGDVLVWG